MNFKQMKGSILPHKPKVYVSLYVCMESKHMVKIVNTITYITAPVNKSKNKIGNNTSPLWDPLRFLLQQQQQQHRTNKMPNPNNSHRIAKIMPGSAVYATDCKVRTKMSTK